MHNLSNYKSNLQARLIFPLDGFDFGKASLGNHRNSTEPKTAESLRGAPAAAPWKVTGMVMFHWAAPLCLGVRDFQS